MFKERTDKLASFLVTLSVGDFVQCNEYQQKKLHDRSKHKTNQRRHFLGFRYIFIDVSALNIYLVVSLIISKVDGI